MLKFSSLARLEVPEKFLWWVAGGGVCKVIFMPNPTVVLCWGWGFDNDFLANWNRQAGKLRDRQIMYRVQLALGTKFLSGVTLLKKKTPLVPKTQCYSSF